MTTEVIMVMPITKGERTSPMKNTATMKMNRNPNVKFCGLMGMATFTDDMTVVRGDFARLKHLFDEFFSPDFRELSIGMSEDYRIALEYGSTMVRIGTMIFGPRVY